MAPCDEDEACLFDDLSAFTQKSVTVTKKASKKVKNNILPTRLAHLESQAVKKAARMNAARNKHKDAHGEEAYEAMGRREEKMYARTTFREVKQAKEAAEAEMQQQEGELALMKAEFEEEAKRDAESMAHLKVEMEKAAHQEASKLAELEATEAVAAQRDLETLKSRIEAATDEAKRRAATRRRELEEAAVEASSREQAMAAQLKEVAAEAATTSAERSKIGGHIRKDTAATTQNSEVGGCRERCLCHHEGSKAQAT